MFRKTFGASLGVATVHLPQRETGKTTTALAGSLTATRDTFSSGSLLSLLRRALASSSWWSMFVCCRHGIPGAAGTLLRLQISMPFCTGTCHRQQDYVVRSTYTCDNLSRFCVTSSRTLFFLVFCFVCLCPPSVDRCDWGKKSAMKLYVAVPKPYELS